MDSKKLYVFLTVDTEASMHRGQPLSPDLMIYGRIGGSNYGIPWIMETCNRFECPATFFVSALEALHYGESMVKEVCDTIRVAGHDVQLHIHSSWYNGRKFLWENSLHEQVGLIRNGREILERATGEPPVAHRAGGLGANLNTLQALATNGVPIDSSMYFRGPNCKLWPHLNAMNSICRWQEVIEIPVTQFSQFGMASWKSYRTFDINADILSELKIVLRQAKRQRLKTLTLLMHSFSFVHRSPDRSSISPNPMDMRRFEKFLTYLRNDPEIEVITFTAFYDCYRDNLEDLVGSDYLPCGSVAHTLVRSIRHFNRSRKNKAMVFGALGMMLTALAIIVLLF